MLLIALAIVPLGLATPVKRWYADSIGANYFQTNGFQGNQLVSSYIMPNGSLVAGSACWTYGNGSAGINDPDPYENHPDPFYASGSVMVSACHSQVFVTNAGSDSFSVFNIDPTDPGRPTYCDTYSSNGEFPIGFAASPDGNMLCVLNAGKKNGFSCYAADWNGGWMHEPKWDRDFGLNITSPPHGPVGGTPSQIIFAQDSSSLIAVIKGQLPTDLNNPSGKMQPGAICTYSINGGSLAQTPQMAPAAIPFSVTYDLTDPDVYFMSDVSTGYAVYEPGTMGAAGTLKQGMVPNQAAVCWAAQSPLTNNFYVVDIAGKSNITEISVDTSSLTGTVITHHALGVNASGTDNSIYHTSSKDWMYVNAPAYHSVHAFEITGPGEWSLFQRFGPNDMMNIGLVPTMGFSGQAVYHKPGDISNAKAVFRPHSSLRLEAVFGRSSTGIERVELLPDGISPKTWSKMPPPSCPSNRATCVGHAFTYVRYSLLSKCCLVSGSGQLYQPSGIPIAWLLHNVSSDVPSATATFWQGQPLTWQIFARVNGTKTYCLFGCGDSGFANAQQTGLSFTATHTLIDLKAGDINLQLDFFSPVSLTDYTRQSTPYSYLGVTVQDPHLICKIDVMTALDDTWTSQQPNTQAQAFMTDAGSRGFMLSGKSSYNWAENDQMAAWGNVTLAAHQCNGGQTSYQIGSAQNITSYFDKNGRLSGEVSSYTSGDLVAVCLSLDGGVPSGNSWTATFAIGLEQENAFNYLGTPLTGYYAARLGYGPKVVDHFFADASAALAEGCELDDKVQKLGETVSSGYADILNSAVLQTFGSLQVLIPLESKNTSEARAFTKEISTDGNVQTVADLDPRMFPAFYALAPDYMRLMLKPLLEYSLQWPAQFAFHDLGKSYPNATGETVATEEALLVDQTAVFHWLAYAYKKISGDSQFFEPYIPTLQKYADYLVQNGLYTAKQKSAIDSIAGTANQTVLAVYSAIGLTCFGALSGQGNYTSIGKHFAEVSLELGLSPNKTHLRANFGDSGDTWITSYPFAYDKMLSLGTYNESIYALQSDWYETKIGHFAMPFYSGVTYTVGDLMAWAASTSSNDVSNKLLDGIHNFLTDGRNNVPGPTLWYVTGNQTGKYMGSIAKGNTGSYFMPIAANER